MGRRGNYRCAAKRSSLRLGLLAVGIFSGVASADLIGTGQYSDNPASQTLDVGTTAQGTFTVSGCQCGPNQSLSRKDINVGSMNGGDGLLTTVNAFPGFGEVALRVSQVLRVGAPSFNSEDVGFGRLVVGLHTVAIGSGSGMGSRFNPFDFIEVGGPESQPAEMEVRGRVVAFDIISIGDYGHGVLNVYGSPAQFSPNGLLVGNRGRGVVNVTSNATIDPFAIDFAAVGLGGEINVFGNGSAIDTFLILTLQGSGEGAEVNVTNGGRLTVHPTIANPTLANINATGGGVFSPSRINVVYDDLASDPPLIESIDMTLRHTRVRASGPGAMIDLSGAFQTLSAGNSPTMLTVENGAELSCDTFNLLGRSNDGEADVFRVRGAGSAINVANAMDVAGDRFTKCEVYAEDGATIDAGPVSVATLDEDIRAEGLVELTGGSQLSADSIDLAANQFDAFDLHATLRVCDSSVATVTGAVNVGLKGVLQGSGTVSAGGGVFNDGGTVIAGCSPGSLNILGNFDQPVGKLIVGLGAGEPSKLIVDGSANIAGEIVVELREGLLPDATLSLEMIEATGGATVDPGAVVSLMGLEGVMSGEVTASGSGVMVDVSPTPGRADFSGNGITDLQDFRYMQQCFSGPGTPAGCFGDGEIDADDDVDLRDLQIMQLSFGEGM